MSDKDAPNCKRSRMIGHLSLLHETSKIPINSKRETDKDVLINFMSSALLAITMRHQLTVQKFGGMIICEGCGELAGPDGDLCEELQVVWDALYPEFKRE